MSEPAPSASRRRCLVLLVSTLGVGGAERHMVTLANRLSEHFDVVLAYLKRDDGLLPQVQVERLRGVECLDLARRVDVAGIRRLGALFDRYGADAVLCANHFPMVYAMLGRLASTRRVRVIEVFHSTLLGSLKGRLEMALVYRPMNWFANALVFVCEAQRRHWTRRGLLARRVHTIYNGVDTSRFDLEPFAEAAADARRAHDFSPDDLVLGICAVLRPEKAHVDLLEATARARDAGIDWKLLIIGDGPMRPQIEEAIERLRLADRVRITGLVSDVRPLVAACDALTLVSRTETFSVAALEAMAMGKPMIMSDIGGARERIVPGETGWVFPPGDVGALTACLREAADRSRLRRMGLAARDRTRSLFSVETMVDRYVRLVQGLPAGQ